MEEFKVVSEESTHRFIFYTRNLPRDLAAHLVGKNEISVSIGQEIKFFVKGQKRTFSASLIPEEQLQECYRQESGIWRNLGNVKKKLQFPPELNLTKKKIRESTKKFEEDSKARSAIPIETFTNKDGRKSVKRQPPTQSKSRPLRKSKPPAVLPSKTRTTTAQRVDPTIQDPSKASPEAKEDVQQEKSGVDIFLKKDSREENETVLHKDILASPNESLFSSPKDNSPVKQDIFSPPRQDILGSPPNILRSPFKSKSSEDSSTTLRESSILVNSVKTEKKLSKANSLMNLFEDSPKASRKRKANENILASPILPLDILASPGFQREPTLSQENNSIEKKMEDMDGLENRSEQESNLASISEMPLDEQDNIKQEEADQIQQENQTKQSPMKKEEKINSPEHFESVSRVQEENQVKAEKAISISLFPSEEREYDSKYKEYLAVRNQIQHITNEFKKLQNDLKERTREEKEIEKHVFNLYNIHHQNFRKLKQRHSELSTELKLIKKKIRNA